MLQTRISLRLSSAALAVVVLLCYSVYLTAAQPARSCTNTASSLAAHDQSVAAKTAIFDQLKDESVLTGVCKLDKTCCSKEAETMFKDAMSSHYRDKIQSALASTLIPCHNHSVLGEIVEFIGASKDNLVSVMQRQFSIYFTPYVHIFDEFYEYLETSVWTGDICQIKEQFTKVSFEMFLAAYIVTAQSQGEQVNLPDTDEFRSCFFEYFLEVRGDAIYNKLNGFLRAYNLTMRYVRALKLLDDVIEGVVDFTLTRQCQDAIMKMTHCSQCAGYNGELLPCRGLCQNCLRGCLVDLVDMVKPIKDFTDAIVNMNKLLNDTYNPWVQITLLNSYFFQTVTHTREQFADINQNLFLRCDSQGQRQTRSVADQKRSAPLLAVPRDSIEGLDRERRFVSSRAAPPPPYAAMNFSSHCIYDTLSIFTSLSEKLCEERSIAKDNGACWTGGSFGSYERAVFDLDRSAQRNNPELMVCTTKSRLDVQVAQLRFMTRELNILTGSQECSDDDEDCVDTVPDMCSYYEFPDTYDISEDVTGSGSGSGDDDIIFGTTSEQDDACASVEGTRTVTSAGPTDAFGGGGGNETVTGGATKLTSASVLLTLFLVSVSLVAMMTSSSWRSYL